MCIRDSYNADNPTEYPFSGKRVHRGLYKTANGKTFNADINGALNIMRKSSVVDINILYSRGEVDTPVRIRTVSYTHLMGARLHLLIIKQ